MGQTFPAVSEIDSLSGRDYVQTFIKSRYPGMTMEQLRYNSGLRCLESFLKKSPEIRVLHNLDDPLLSQDDAHYLSRTLGGRMIWFDHGAHLGNLYLKEYQKQLLNATAGK